MTDKVLACQHPHHAVEFVHNNHVAQTHPTEQQIACADAERIGNRERRGVGERHQVDATSCQVVWDFVFEGQTAETFPEHTFADGDEGFVVLWVGG